MSFAYGDSQVVLGLGRFWRGEEGTAVAWSRLGVWPTRLRACGHCALGTCLVEGSVQSKRTRDWRKCGSREVEGVQRAEKRGHMRYMQRQQWFSCWFSFPSLLSWVVMEKTLTFDGYWVQLGSADCGRWLLLFLSLADLSLILKSSFVSVSKRTLNKHCLTCLFRNACKT